MSEDLALLVDRWSDGDLPEAERAALFARLTREPAFARAFVDETRFRGQLGGLLGARADDRLWQRVDAVVRATSDTGRHRFADRVEARVAGHTHPRATSGRARRSRSPVSWWPMALAVAAAVIVAVGLVFFQPQQSAAPQAPAVAVAPAPPAAHDLPALATIKTCSGAAIDGHPACAGMFLRALQVLATGADGAVAISYDDGTRVEIGPGSSLSLADEGGAKRLRLERGTLSASVAKQPTGRAMRLATPAAVATVVGTRFVLAADPLGAELTVTEGRVAFGPAGGGATVEVAAGESARVADGGVAKRSPPSPEQARLLAVRELIVPQADERPWAAMPWMIDLWAARRRAVETGKPLLLWAAWGHPLGMCAEEGIVDREWWRDAELRRLADGFVPVAVDTWYLTRRHDAVGKFFAGLVARAGDHSTTRDGIYCCDAAGTLFGFCTSGCSAGAVREMLSAAAAKAVAVHPEIPAAAADPKLAPTLPPDALRLEVFARAVARDAAGDGSWRAAAAAVGIDHAWLSAPEWRQLATIAAPVGERRPFPADLAMKLVRFHLSDFTRGEAWDWGAGEVLALDLSLVVEEATATGQRLRIEGSARLGNRTRGFEPAFAGTITVAAGRITAFELVAVGDHWDDDHPARPRAPLGIAMRLAGDQPADAVPPHAMRDVRYLAPAPDQP